LTAVRVAPPVSTELNADGRNILQLVREHPAAFRLDLHRLTPRVVTSKSLFFNPEKGGNAQFNFIGQGFG
jgi:hypothetical protein